MRFNYAVLVCSSRFWFNYRHIQNTLEIYTQVKRLGLQDENIILMLADDVLCNPRHRNPKFKDMEIDYRGYEVTAENLMRVLTNRHPPHVPKNKRLETDNSSRILVYLTGHGGDEFLKFQDQEEISAQDLADAFEQMYQKQRYKEILFLVDTCQANTLYQHFRSPNILASGSSKLGQNSYSHHHDANLGVSVIDSYTFYVTSFLKKVKHGSKMDLNQLFQSLDPILIKSQPGLKTDLFQRNLNETLVTDFFGAVPHAVLQTHLPLILKRNPIF